MSATADYKFYVDWTNSGLFDGPNDDVTADVIACSIQRGFSGPPPEPCNAGTLTIKLKNGTGKYSPWNSFSPIYSGNKPGRRVRVTMSIDSGAEEVLATCRLDNVEPDTPEVLPAGTAQMNCLGTFSMWAKSEVNIPLQENIPTGDAISLILAASGIEDPSSIEIDTGQSAISKWWVKNDQNPLEAMRELEAHELGRFFEGKDGNPVFRDRHYYFKSPGNTVRSSYGAGGLRMWDPIIVNPLPNIFNRVRTNVRTFNHSDGQILVTVTDSVNGLGGKPILLTQGQTKTIWLELPADSQFISVYEWLAEGAGLAYQCDTNINGTGVQAVTDNVDFVRTDYSQKMKVDFTNNNAFDCYIVVLTASGIAVVESDPLPIKSDDVPSQNDYTINEYPNPSSWITDQEDGQAMIDYIVSTYKNPRPQVTFKIIANVDDAHLAEAQAIDVGDRIHITDSESLGSVYGLYVDQDFIVDNIQHDISPDIEGGLHTVIVSATAAPTVELPADGTPYASKTIPTDTGVPDDLLVDYWSNGLVCTTGASCWKYNVTIDKAEFRATRLDPNNKPAYVDLRTVAEGGTLVHDGVDSYIVELPIAAATAKTVTKYVWTSAEDGNWFFAYRFHNDKGWSVWSDGNTYPERVADCVSTGGLSDNGPPADWTVWIESGAVAGTAVIKATRPQTNGNRIVFGFWQIRDTAASGAGSAADWQNLDDNSGPSDTYFDGSAIDFTSNADGSRLTRNSGSGFGTAQPGDLLMFDVRGGMFERNYCQFLQLTDDAFPEGDPSTATYIQFQTPGVVMPGITDYRIKIVKPPWEWDTEGYLGAPGYKMTEYWNIKNTDGTSGDITSSVFVSPTFTLPAGVELANVVGRLWYGNTYSFSDDNESTPEGTNSSTDCCISIPDWQDPVVLPVAPNTEWPPKVYRINMQWDCTLAAPVGATCGQTFRCCIINESGVTRYLSLANNFRVGYICPPIESGDPGPFAICDTPIPIPTGSQGYLEFIYDEAKDKFDVLSWSYLYMGTPSILVDIWGYWTMDSASSTRQDATGNNHDLALENGTVDCVTGLVSNAAQFDGTSDLLQCNEAFDPSNNNAFTIAAWINGGANPNNPRTVLEINANAGIYVIAHVADDNLKVEAYTDSRYVSSGFDYVKDTWHLVVLVYDKDASELRLYVDNSLISTDPGEHGIAGSYGVTYVGGLSSGVTTKVDEMGIWTRALTTDEVDYLWNSGSGRALY